MLSAIVPEKRCDVLQHEAEQPPQLVEIQLADVDAVDQDPSAADVVEPQQQVDERRLARPGRADDADALARLDDERDVAQHVRARRRRRTRRGRTRCGRAASASRARLRAATAGVVDRPTGVSSSVKMRSEAAIAACRMLNFSDRSVIGWKNRREYCRNATSTPSDTTPSFAQPPPIQMISAPESAASTSITG